jgi:hypothetical protein
MKKIAILFASVALLASCSSPKYSYYFDHYNYNSGKKQSPVDVAAKTEQSPLLINDQQLVADASTTPVSSVEKITVPAEEKKALENKIASMTKEQRNTLKKELKTELKKYIKAGKKDGNRDASVKAAKEWDEDLKMAAIFGSVGVILTILGGVNTIFWVLGVIAFVIAVVFFIKWLARQ